MMVLNFVDFRKHGGGEGVRRQHQQGIGEEHNKSGAGFGKEAAKNKRVDIVEGNFGDRQQGE